MKSLVSLLVLSLCAGCGGEALVESDVPCEPGSDSAGLSLTACTPLPVRSVRARGDDGNVPQNTLDDRLDTRWSEWGRGAWIEYDLGREVAVGAAAIAWHQGNRRTNAFRLALSGDGASWTEVHSGRSSGATTAAETYAFRGRRARYLRVFVDGNSLNDWASIAEARVCAQPEPPAGSVVWRGDFETGDRSQWTRAQMVGPDRLQVVASPVREGRFALKATVRQGDDPIGASGNRNELVYLSREPAGSEFFYRWSNLWPADYPSEKTWQLFAQWHHEGSSGSPPVEFFVFGEEVRLRVGGSSGTTVWTAPLVRGRWQDFVFHVKWSPDASVGFVELYLDGRLVLPKRHVATQYRGQLNYLKAGLYRSESIVRTGVVYHDGWLQARRLEDVL